MTQWLHGDPTRVARQRDTIEGDPDTVAPQHDSVAARKRAAACLTRHFVRHFLDVGFTSDESADGVRRVMIGVLSAVVAVGLWLPRVIMGKYAAVAAMPDAYRSAVLGDTLMTVAFAMLVVAFAAALAGDSMFPDETDFRVLTPLPLTRGFVFAAKLRAVALYLGVVVVVSVALQLPFTALTGRHSEQTWIVRGLSHAAVSMGASLFAALAVMSIQGVIVLCAPGRYLRPLSVGARTAMLCGTVVLLPLAGRLPDQAAPFAAESPVLSLVPPAWFAGLQRFVVGEGGAYSMTMAALAIASFAAAAAIVALCYTILYQRFDVVILRANVTSRHADPAPTGIRYQSDPVATAIRSDSDSVAISVRHGSEPTTLRLRHRSDPDPQAAVIQQFASRTLWRSPLHQVVFLGITACGVGWVTNSLLAAGLIDWIQHGGVAPPRLVSAATTLPFVLLLAGVTGLRGALLLPQDPRANWIFRMNDLDAHRPGQLDAVERLFIRLVVLPVLAMALPLQWAVLGGDAVPALAIAYLWGVLLVEAVIRNWRRIPFTCSYIPGKRHVAETVLLALMMVAFFTTIGRGLVAVSRAHPSRFVIVLGVLLTITALVRRRRLASWGQTPLMFDDDPPEFAQPLRLS